MELWNWRNRSARTMVEGETPPEAPPDPMLPAQGGMEVGRMPAQSGRPLTAPPLMTQSFMSPIGSMVSTGIQPKRPIMGNLIQITRDEWGVWTGGKPNPGWTGRDEKAPPSFTCPNQLRPIKIVDAQKSFNHCSEGLKDEFKVGNDLQAFRTACGCISKKQAWTPLTMCLIPRQMRWLMWS